MNHSITAMGLSLYLFMSALTLPVHSSDLVKQSEREFVANRAHDQRSDNTNISYCSSLSEYTEKKYQAQKDYYQTFKKQLLDRTQQERANLNLANLKSDELESQINTKAGEQFTDPSRENSKDINQKQKAILAQIKRRQRELRNIQSSPIDSEQKKSRASALRREIQQLQNKYDYMGSQLESQQGNIIASEKSIEASDKADQEGAYAYSGCTDDGECTLNGPLFEQNERLTNLAQQGIAEAEKFARGQFANLQVSELKKSNNSDYKLFEAILSSSQSPEGKKFQESNLEVAARSSAAAKQLSCRPVAIDSKAYHLYRAASAVFLSAMINDTSYHGDLAQCMAAEKFTEDTHNKQVNTLEKVTNLQENVVANLCLRTEPNDPQLQKRCREHIQKIFGSNPEYQDMALARDNALAMYKASHRAALSELKNKHIRIETANKQIAKGKERIKENTRRLMIVIALRLAAKALKINFDAKAKACAAATPTCSSLSYFLSQAAKWAGKVKKYWVLELYFKAQILRWKKFVKKWKAKLKKARVHTHLACNEKEAIQEQAKAQQVAEKSHQQLKKQIKEEKEKLIKEIVSSVQAPRTSSNWWQWRWRWSLFPELHAAEGFKTSSSSLGIGYGSYSFGTFITKRNHHWRLLAQDINSKLTWPPDKYLYHLAYLDENKPSNYGSKALKEILKPLFKSLNSNSEPEGFPIPETRVISTARTIEFIENNIKKTNTSLATAIKQLDTYKNLLNKAKTRLSPNHQGLVEAAGPRFSKKVHCGEGKGKNLRFSPECSCQKNDSCTQFKFPQFGELTDPNSEYQLVEGIGNDVLAGKLKSANVKGSLLKKKNAFYNNNSLNSFKIKNQSEKSEGPSLSNSSKRVPGQEKKINIVNSATERAAPTSQPATTAKLSSQDLSKKQSASDTSGLVRKPSVVSPRAKGSSFPTSFGPSDETVELLPPVDDLLDESDREDTSPTREIASDKNRAWQKGIASSRHLSSQSTSIFQIVSRRYRKSAYPILISPSEKKPLHH